MKKYWMIHGENCGSPTMKHKSIIDADTEAMRLARANPDTKFALLEAIEYYICELPKPKAYKTETPDNCEALAEAAGMIPKMRGLHPENIVWDAGVTGVKCSVCGKPAIHGEGGAERGPVFYCKEHQPRREG